MMLILNQMFNLSGSHIFIWEKSVWGDMAIPAAPLSTGLQWDLGKLDSRKFHIALYIDLHVCQFMKLKVQSVIAEREK